jgi:hypothetical protein
MREDFSGLAEYRAYRDEVNRRSRIVRWVIIIACSVAMAVIAYL